MLKNTQEEVEEVVKDKEPEVQTKTSDEILAEKAKKKAERRRIIKEAHDSARQL